ncbi:HAMP domain-containing protein [Chloroflexi bacterium TSY]|nr:HAMP domain-containing protein [Chloroflexi bacterium TSY]
MNRLWVRLSIAFGMVLAIVLALPTLIFVLILSPLNPWQPNVALALSDPECLVDNLDPQQPIILVDDQCVTGSVGLRQIASELVTEIAIALFVGGVVGVIAGAIVSRQLTKPVTQLTEGVKAIRRQDLGHRVEVSQSVQEYVDLADSFNQMVQDLEHADQVRRNLLADVSHELLTPLTVLEGNLRAMLDGVYRLDQEELGYLYDETQHLIRLVKDLRQLSQAEARQLPLNLVETNMDDLAQESTALFEPAATEKGITLTMQGSDETLIVQVDPGRVRQVVANLLSNAVRHTSDGGRITVRVQRVDDHVQLSIEDDGDGIDAQDLDQVFDRFYRTDGTRRRDTGGAGLGLAIVKAIVEAHGGWVSVASEGLNRGSTFAIHFPIKAFPENKISNSIGKVT